MRMSKKDWLEKHVSTHNRKQKMRVAISWNRAERHRKGMQESEVELTLKQSLPNKASSVRPHDGKSPQVFLGFPLSLNVVLIEKPSRLR